MKMKHKWKMDVDTQCFKFDYNFFDDIKVTLDLPSSLDVDDHNWTISARSPLKVNRKSFMHNNCLLQSL